MFFAVIFQCLFGGFLLCLIVGFFYIVLLNFCLLVQTFIHCIVQIFIFWAILRVYIFAEWCCVPNCQTPLTFIVALAMSLIKQWMPSVAESFRFGENPVWIRSGIKFNCGENERQIRLVQKEATRKKRWMIEVDLTFDKGMLNVRMVKCDL